MNEIKSKSKIDIFDWTDPLNDIDAYRVFALNRRIHFIKGKKCVPESPDPSFYTFSFDGTI